MIRIFADPISSTPHFPLGRTRPRPEAFGNAHAFRKYYPLYAGFAIPGTSWRVSSALANVPVARDYILPIFELIGEIPQRAFIIS